jgi:hypothetical protein
MNLRNPDDVIETAKRLVDADKRSEIRLNANGGNSILVVCEPMREKEYIQSMVNLMPVENYEIINLNDMLTRYIESNKQDLSTQLVPFFGPS